MAKKLTINDNCNWLGWLPLEEANAKMAKGHLFCISNLKDLTSTVTLEALSYGLPIICLDHCGFAHVVNESCGIKIPVTNPKEVEIGFTNAIEKMYNDESLRQRLAKGALARALDFSWDKKIEKLNHIYGNLLK